MGLAVKFQMCVLVSELYFHLPGAELMWIAFLLGELAISHEKADDILLKNKNIYICLPVVHDNVGVVYL